MYFFKSKEKFIEIKKIDAQYYSFHYGCAPLERIDNQKLIRFCKNQHVEDIFFTDETVVRLLIVIQTYPIRNLIFYEISRNEFDIFVDTCNKDDEECFWKTQGF